LRLGRKFVLAAALAALAMFVFGGSALAHDPVLHPAHTCWDIEKSASVHGQPVTELLLSLGQTITVDYEVVVTQRECGLHETPHDSVDVLDSFAGTLALHLAHPATFHYSRDITAHDCHPFDVSNTATVRNNVDLDTDTVTIHVKVACEQGCTLTQGYWKTHSNRGPAPADSTWNLLPAAQDTAAFLPYVDAKGDPGTWYSIFWTPPSGGNVYYQLAHQYMAAQLNILNGASAPASVTSALAGANGFFAAYTPAEAGALGKTSAARTQALAWAGTLGSYNEGAIGPGHCDE
jgi:hypothetical protein